MKLTFRLLLVATAVLIASCTRDVVQNPDAATILKDFIPPGWTVEFDTVAPLLGPNRMGHLTVLSQYDSNLHTSFGRMVMIVGPDKSGKLVRLGANKVLLPKPDMSSADYQPPMNEMVRLKKDVITIITHQSGAETEAFRAREFFKLRFDPATNRIRLIGYDLNDNTDGIQTLDSRNYLTKKRGIQQIRGKDTLFHRTLPLRHVGAFLEDLQPWQFAVEPQTLRAASGPVPETTNEVMQYYNEPADTTQVDDYEGVAS